jgi:hypothetical protein
MQEGLFDMGIGETAVIVLVVLFVVVIIGFVCMWVLDKIAESYKH